MSIELSITGSEVEQLFARLAKAGKDKGTVLSRIGAFVREEASLNFTASQDPYGVPWAPLKLRQGQPLLDTGRLRNSLTYRVSGDTVEVGTNVRYASVHQYGATISAKNKPFLIFKTPAGYALKKQVTIPARPYLPTAERGLPDAYNEGILALIRNYVDEVAA